MANAATSREYRSRTAGSSSGPTERTWWEATQAQLLHPAEWGAGFVVLIAVLAVGLTAAVIWVTQPGRLLGSTPAFDAGLVYGSADDGRYVYEMHETPDGKARMQATLQALYDAHRAGAQEGGALTLTVIRRAASAGPFIQGTADPASPDIVGRIVVRGDRREAALRGGTDRPLEPIDLAW
jgi:hypothetical protein